jgi:tRNA pseudouridine55 synthase
MLPAINLRFGIVAGLSESGRLQKIAGVIDPSYKFEKKFVGFAVPHFGILNVNKPAGRSSRRVVDTVERLVRPAKAGHAGTLDPLASGVLVVCVGQATRLISYVQQMPKTYRATFLLGCRSETDDVEGEVTQIADATVPTRANIESALPRFLGEIEQVPPAHSAVKIGGRRAYKLARAGKEVQLSPRRITVHELSIRSYDYPQLELDVQCGSGTYVRSLGRDLAASLSTSAVMSALVRTAIGEFRVEDAVALDRLAQDTVKSFLRPAMTAVPHLAQLAMDEPQLAELRHGRPALANAAVQRKPFEPQVEIAVVNAAGELAAIVREKLPGEFWPVTNFG